MSEEIRVQGLTTLSFEPQRWETPLAIIFTKSQKDCLLDIDEANVVLPPVLYLSGSKKDAKDESYSDNDKPLS